MFSFIASDFGRVFCGSFFKNSIVAKANKQKVKIISKFLCLIHNKYTTNNAQVLKDY